MERRGSLNRARVDLPVFSFVDGFRHACRAIDLSSTGMVISRSRALRDRDLPILSAFELHLREQGPIRGRARSVWTRDGLHAVRFVTMEDVDRLTIAEHLDRLARLREEVH